MITNPSVWRAPAGAPAQGASGARAAPFGPVPPPRASVLSQKSAGAPECKRISETGH